MGKTKHEKLASQLKNLIIHIEQRVKKLKDKLKALQLCFMSNFSDCSESVREIMVLCNHVALQILIPSIKKRGVSSKTLAYALMNTEEHLAIIEKYRKKALVCCSTDDRINKRLKLFESEERANSISHQFLTILALRHEWRAINLNANSLSKPIFSAAVSRWQESGDHADKISTSDSLWNFEFSPKENQTAWEAWQVVVKITRQKKYPHRRGLLSIYRKLLEEQFFYGLDMSKGMQQIYIKKFESRVFNLSSIPKKKRPGRWIHCQAISLDEAALLIEYFIRIFLKNYKQRKFGEIVCVLWIMICCAQEVPELVHEKDVFTLTVGDVDSINHTIYISGQKIHLPPRLIKMLLCLCGKAPLEDLLFQNISPKIVRNELAKASKKVLLNGMVVMPSAFLSLLHPFQGLRIEKSQRDIILGNRKVTTPLWTKEHLLKELAKAASI